MQAKAKRRQMGAFCAGYRKAMAGRKARSAPKAAERRLHDLSPGHHISAVTRRPISGTNFTLRFSEGLKAQQLLLKLKKN